MTEIASCQVLLNRPGIPMCLVSPRNGDLFTQKRSKVMFFFVRSFRLRSKFCLTAHHSLAVGNSTCDTDTLCFSSVSSWAGSRRIYVPYLNPQYSARYGTGRTASGRLVVQSAVDPILKSRLSQTSSLLAETALRAGDYTVRNTVWGITTCMFKR